MYLRGRPAGMAILLPRGNGTIASSRNLYVTERGYTKEGHLPVPHDLLLTQPVGSCQLTSGLSPAHRQ
jgi:hypothetical protein